MFNPLLLILATLAGGEQGFTEPLADEKSAAEYGHKLAKEEALAGWIALFDGKTTFGWQDAKVENGTLTAGKTTSPFQSYMLRINAVRAGKLRAGAFELDVGEGLQLAKVAHPSTPLELADGLVVSELAIKPAQLTPLLDGKGLGGWKAIPYPNARPSTKVTWEVKDGFVLAKGGPGALEYQGISNSDRTPTEPPTFQDFILQADVRTAEKHTNGGIFLRNQPGTVMMGYEAQLHNRVYDTRAGVSGCCTGSIDDRQHARRLVCRDGEMFRLTAIVAGPHISIWVNGYQTADWTDTRAADENPRKGLRLAGGTLQLQAHDPETNIEFHQVLVRELKSAQRN